MPPKKRKFEDDTESSEQTNENEVDGENGTESDDGLTKEGDNGGLSGNSVDNTTESDAAEAEETGRPDFIVDGSKIKGEILMCGGTNWDLMGRKDAPKNAKKGSGSRNLWGPHRLTTLKGVAVRTVVAGCTARHNIVITAEGRVLSWGRNDKGQLGLGDCVRRDQPVYVDGLKEHNIVSAACGRNHSLCLTDHGHVYSFGDNKLAQCGLGHQNQSVLTPCKVNFKGSPIIRVACGAEFSMIVDYKGSLYSFGCPEYGQLGHNTDGRYFVSSNKLAYTCELVPRRISVFIERTREGHIIPLEDSRIVDVACGVNHTIALDTKKRVFTWGFGGYGRLGHAEPKDEMVPRILKVFDGPGRGARSVYAGATYCMIISEHGALFFWGQNRSAGEATMYPKPVHDLTGWTIRDVACSYRSIVVAAEESIISWGPSPTYGELGYGDNKPRSSTSPQEVKTLDGIHIHAVACGFAHTLMIARCETDEERKKLERFPDFP